MHLAEDASSAVAGLWAAKSLAAQCHFIGRAHTSGSNGAMMKILAIEREIPGFTAADFVPHLQAEAARAWELYQAGIVREIYFRQDRSEAVLILECASPSEAETTLQTLPLVKAGLITFELIPLKPYPGFARLFTTHVEKE